MKIAELIFLSVCTAVMAIFLLAAPNPGFPSREWEMVLGVLLLVPSAVTVVAMTVSSKWFQRVVRKSQEQDGSQ